MGALDGLAQVAGSAIAYVKPHGALYNAIVHHHGQAKAVVDAVLAYDPTLPVLGLPGSIFLEEAERAGLRTVAEAFADRAYTAQGTLVSRSEPGAVPSDPDAVAQRVLTMITDGTTRAIDGSRIDVAAESICLHGDFDAVAMATAVSELLRANDIDITAFV